MVHSGYEPSAVNATFGSWRGFWRTARIALFGAPKNEPLPEVVSARIDGSPASDGTLPRPLTPLRRTADGRIELPVLK
jgi:hypothetical protein